MDIFWASVGVVWAAYSWVCDAIGNIARSIGFTNLLLMMLIYQVYKIRETYIEFESAKLARDKRDNLR